MLRTIFVALTAVLVSNSAFAATVASTWTEFSETAAVGDIDGISISATSSPTSPLIGFSTDRFDTEGGWDATLPLDREVAGLVASDVNAGDQQVFEFASAIGSGMLYIENFDSNSVATITAAGDDTDLLLVTGSPSIDFESSSPGSGVLSTSNPDSNGEGDAVLQFNGNVTGITVNYSAGDGSNGIFYAFAVVPEPNSSSLCLMGLVMLGLLTRKP